MKNKNIHEIINLQQGQKIPGTHDEFARDVRRGLSESPRSIPSRYFYDDRGSDLFRQITGLDDYYLTNSEIASLELAKADIVRILGQDNSNLPLNIVEPGCGDGHKTMILLNEFIEKGIQVRYIPIDISQRAINLLLETLDDSKQLNCEIIPIVSEYFTAIDYVEKNLTGKNLILFLGSSIGNFTRDLAIDFLRHLFESMTTDDHALIGFDLIKDNYIMQNAYDDSEGITAEFNFNLLDRMNRELGANFSRENFMHEPRYNEEIQSMESGLRCKVEHFVTIEDLNQTFHFHKDEYLHLEYSHKYTLTDVIDLAAESGFDLIKNFTDPGSYFVNTLWRVP